MSGDEPTLLTECADPIELATVKSLLDGQSIPYVAQGENHHALIGGAFGGGAVIALRVLVPARELERARALLAAAPVLDGTQPENVGGLEGSVCPVHEKAAVATCGRCGTFLCAECHSLGNPPECEDCLKRDAEPRKGGFPWAFAIVIVVVGAVIALLSLGGQR